MSPTELEARRWRAVVDAVRGKRDDLAINYAPQHDGRVAIRMSAQSWVDIDAWLALTGEPRARIYLYCSKTEWVEMLTQGGK